jgi:hypothetical protein
LQRPVRGGERDRDEHGRVVTGEDAAEQRVVHGESVDRLTTGGGGVSAG